MTNAPITVSCHGPLHIWRLANGIPDYGTLCDCGGRIWTGHGQSVLARGTASGKTAAAAELAAWVEECCQ